MRALLLSLLVVASAQAAPASSIHEDVMLTFTAHGIPHVRAKSAYGAGYGQGYATAKLDSCGLVLAFIDGSGRRAEVFGGAQTSINQLLGREVRNDVHDWVTRLSMDDTQLKFQRTGLSAALTELVNGYADGVNAYFEKNPEWPGECRSWPWKGPISADDVLKRVAQLNLLLGTGAFDAELFDAHPPSRKSAANPTHDPLSSPLPDPTAAGSNGYAFGKEMTANGRGLLLGNPHWFWYNPNRFIEGHITFGNYDAMGATILGMPLITIGFNRSMAWTHTVSTDRRVTLFKLVLDGAQGLRYRWAKAWHAIEPRTVEIESRDDHGNVTRRQHTFWMTQFGPIVESRELPWTSAVAYALADANQFNNRALEQWFSLGQAHNVNEALHALEKTVGLPWVNTIAADSRGQALYADISVAPNVSRAQFKRCVETTRFIQQRFAVVLAGKPECQWQHVAGSPAVGLIPGANKPHLLTAEYVENSNSSYWLVNRRHLLTGFSPIIGAEEQPVNLRTRQGHLQIDEWLHSSPRKPSHVDMVGIERLLLAAHNGATDFLLDDLLSACARRATLVDTEHAMRLEEACRVLSNWDRRDDLSSVGAQVFREFIREVTPRGAEDPTDATSLWRKPFDPVHPLHTPSGLSDPSAALLALDRAVTRLREAEIPLDAPLGKIQFVVRNGERIPIYGGLAFSNVKLKLVPRVGYTDPAASSNSYIQIVSFDEHGPIADAILVNSQSSNPGSPFYSDQTWMYSRKQWVRLPFESGDIDAQAIERSTLRVTLPKSSH